MKGVILQYKDHISFDERERLTDFIKHDIERNGFAVIDNSFTVYEVDSIEVRGEKNE